MFKKVIGVCILSLFLLLFAYATWLGKQYLFSDGVKYHSISDKAKSKINACLNASEFIDCIKQLKFYLTEKNLRRLKNEFILATEIKTKKWFNSTTVEYSPAPAIVEQPDSDIADSWAELKKYNLSIIPAPKRFKVTGEPIPIGSDWVFVVKNPGVKAGIDEINKKIIEAGGKKILEESSNRKNAIIIGTFDNLLEYLLKSGSPEKPKRQGYVIDFYKENGKVYIVIAGSDVEGVRYGCITFSMMIKKGPKIIQAKVTDWPDYKYRSISSILINPHFETVKKQIDQAFLAKTNMIWAVGGFWLSRKFEDMLTRASDWRKINEYAAERGIRIMYDGWWNVGYAPIPKEAIGESGKYTSHYFYYPYKPEEGLIGHRGMSFTWSRDDLLIAKGKLLAEVMQKTGVNTFYLETMDTRGENWHYRTELDKKRFGDDRASADANVINLIYNEIKKQNQNVLLFVVVHPYIPYYLRYQAEKNWMERLSKLVPEEIYFVVREDVRGNTEVWKNSNRQGRFNYHYGGPLLLLFSSAGRYAKTFYFDDRDIYAFLMGDPSGSSTWAHAWVVAEYAWNTQSPGWGWFPRELTDSWKITLMESSPNEIIEELLPRICNILFGEEAAVLMAKVFAQHLSCDLAGDFSKLTGADPEAYFKTKYEAAKKSIDWLREAESKVVPKSRDSFDKIKAFVTSARYLLEARYRYFVAQQKNIEKDYIGAKAEIELAKAALQKGNLLPKYSKYKQLSDIILKDLNEVAQAIKN